MAYFRQRYRQNERVPPGGQLHQVRTVGRPWPGGEGSGLGSAENCYFGYKVSADYLLGREDANPA